MNADAGNKESEMSPQKTCIVEKITRNLQGAPVDADGDEVEDRGGGADDVHGQVEVTNPHRQVPLTPVHLPMMVLAPTGAFNVNVRNFSYFQAAIFLFSLSPRPQSHISHFKMANMQLRATQAMHMRATHKKKRKKWRQVHKMRLKSS